MATDPHEGREQVSTNLSFSEELVRLAEISHTNARATDLLNQCAEHIRDVVSADFVEILETVADGENLVLQASAGSIDPVSNTSEHSLPVEANLGSQEGYTLLKKTEVLFDQADETSRPYKVGRHLAGTGLSNGITIPIPPGQAFCGVLGIFYKKTHRPNTHERAFLKHASHYLAGLILRHKEINSRRRVQKWLRVMEEATIRSISATSRTTTLQGFAKLFSSSRDGISDLCLIDLESEDGEGIVREAAASDGALLSLPATTSPLLYTPDPGSPHGPSTVLDTGQPHTLSNVEREDLEALAQDEHHLQAFEEMKPVSVMCLPIKQHRHTLGALVLVSRTRMFDHDDERHAGRLAYLVGMSIEAIQARMRRLNAARRQMDEYFRVPAREADENIRDKPFNEAMSEPPATEQGPEGTPELAGEPDQVILPSRRRIILDLICEGKTTQQIATQLNITPSTVYGTEYKLREVFDAENRTSLIRNANKHCLENL